MKPSVPVFSLTTFGALEFRAPPDAAPDLRERAEQFETRRRALALLVVLALSPRPLSRDVLADFFWPNSDPARARHSLVEATRIIRGVLGPSSIEPRARALSLSPEAPLDLDAVRFRDAVHAGRFADAISLYKGDFFEGEFLDRAPRFEHWVDAERDAFQALFLEACKQFLATRPTETATAEDVRIAKRWLAAAPLSEQAALSWLRRLAGDRSAEAVGVTRASYEAWRATLATEYEEEPDPAVVAFMQSLEVLPRTVMTATDASIRGVSAPATEKDQAAVAGVAEVLPPPASVTGAPLLVATAPVPLEARALPVPWLMRGAVLAVAVGVAALGSRVVGEPRGDLRGTPSAPTLVVLADAENTTPDSTLGDAVTVAMSTALLDARTVQVVSPMRVRQLMALSAAPEARSASASPPRLTDSLALVIAARAGASAVVVPVIVSVGDKYRAAVRIVRVRDGQSVAALQSRPTVLAELLGALDDVARQTRKRFGAGSGDEALAASLPDVTTASLPALQAYAEGYRLYRTDAYRPAIAAFRRAVLLDSTFAMAWVAMGEQLNLLNDPQASDSAFSHVVVHLDRLTPRERMQSLARMARVHGQLDSAIAIRQRWIDSYPGDLEVLHGLGYDLTMAQRGPESVAILQRVVARDSTNELGWLNLAYAFKLVAGGERAAVAAFARALRIKPAYVRDVVQGPQFGIALVNAGMLDSAVRVYRAQLDTSAARRGRFYRALGQLALWRGRPDSAAPLFRQAVAASVQGNERLSAARSVLWLEIALRDAGDSAGARVALDSAAQLARHPQVTEPIVLYWIGQRLARGGALADAQRVAALLKSRALSRDLSHRAAELYLRAELEAARGQGTRAVPTARAAIQLDSNVIGLETLAYVTWRSGDYAGADRLYRAVGALQQKFGFEVAPSVQLAPFVLAKIARREQLTGLPGVRALQAMVDTSR